jgi:hypothetical protein
MNPQNIKHSRSRRAVGSTLMTLLTCCFVFTLGSPELIAKNASQLGGVSILPKITSISLNSAGQLVAAGEVTAIVKGKTITADFSDVPVSISLAPDQTGAGDCPILDVQLGAITLNLLGLVVETSPICLTLSAYDDGGLLGDLLCEIADLLGEGGLLGDILGDLVGVNDLLDDLEDLLNGALGLLADAAITNIEHQHGRTCAILNLELGPVDLTLLGLNVHLDDCDDGPITVDITAQRGQLLGNLLCGLLHDDVLALGDTLGDIIDDILNL